MTGTIDRKLHAYIEKLNKNQKKSLLGFIQSIIPANEKGIYTIEKYNKELEEAEAEIERGESYTNEEVFEMSKRLINDRKSN